VITSISVETIAVVTLLSIIDKAVSAIETREGADELIIEKLSLKLILANIPSRRRASCRRTRAAVTIDAIPGRLRGHRG
jgi:hypothetical protein